MPSDAPKEPAQWRGPARFQVLAAGITVDPPGATYGPRTRRHYEWIWMMEGEARAHFDGEIHLAPPGSVMLREPGVSDYYEWSPGGRTVHAWVHFDLDPARRRQVAKAQLPKVFLLPPNDILRPLLGYLLKLAELKEPQRGRLMLPVLDVLLQAVLGGQWLQQSAPRQPIPGPVRKAMQAVQAHLKQPGSPALDLKSLAAAAHCTPVHLCRVFKQALDLAPLEYARLQRLAQAAELLRRSPQSLKEIAEATGFYDANHLAKHFKQVYGLTPKEFKGSDLNEWLTQRNPIFRAQTLIDP